MKIALFAHGQADHVGIVEPQGIVDFSRALQAYELIRCNQQRSMLTSIHEMLNNDMLKASTLEPVLEFMDQHNLRQEFTLPVASSEHPLRAPIRRPGKIIALAGNYTFPGEPDPKEPPFFFKSSSSVIGPEEPIVYKKILNRVEPEIEVAVIIGRRGSNISRQEATQYVAGYTVLNDVTARDLQDSNWKANRPWEYTKSLDTFTPIGPHLVLPDSVGDPHQLAMTMRINGRVVAEANTNTMLFQIPVLLEYISQYMVLEPGDIIATGTPVHPEGLHPGDVVELDIAEIGLLRNAVVAEN
jgi:2-keto-4-pentenoate hydratase/2-oxohepta-3-ene-1,7-dioic acid hydratase in catechol pathway